MITVTVVGDNRSLTPFKHYYVTATSFNHFKTSVRLILNFKVKYIHIILISPVAKLSLPYFINRNPIIVATLQIDLSARYFNFKVFIVLLENCCRDERRIVQAKTVIWLRQLHLHPRARTVINTISFKN